MTAIPTTTIVNIPISQLRDLCLSIEFSATPCRIRFIRCSTLVDYNTLEIVEFEEFPTGLLYAAISYVWKGNDPNTANIHPASEEYGYFTVKGAEDGDPISIDVLRCACIAAMEYSDDMIDYIWLDRACIIQTLKDDKSWQITQMFQVYKNADVCIILGEYTISLRWTRRLPGSIARGRYMKHLLQLHHSFCIAGNGEKGRLELGKRARREPSSQSSPDDARPQT